MPKTTKDRIDIHGSSWVYVYYKKLKPIYSKVPTSQAIQVANKLREYGFEVLLFPRKTNNTRRLLSSVQTT